MKVNIHLHDPAPLTPEKDSPVPIKLEHGVCPRAGLDVWRTGKSPTPPKKKNTLFDVL